MSASKQKFVDSRVVYELRFDRLCVITILCDRHKNFGMKIIVNKIVLCHSLPGGPGLEEN